MSLFLVAAAFMTCACFAQQADPRPSELVGKSPAVTRGLQVEPAGGLTVRVTGGKCIVGAKKVTVRHDVELSVQAAPAVKVENEPLKLGAEKPDSWHTGTRLQGLLSTSITLPGCYTPGSAVVKSSAGADAVVHERDKDYLIDDEWGMLGRVASGKIGADETVYVSYAYSLMRLDTVEVLPDGQVRLNVGKPAKTCPLPAGATGGGLALANVFLPYHAQAVDWTSLFPIGAPFPTPSAEELARRAAQVRATREKLTAGKDVTVVCWGDSVTCGGDVSSPEKAFPEAFGAELQAAYPHAKVHLVNAGIGGTATPGRLPNLQAEVLDKKPDLVVIEFVNDMGLSRDQVFANWGQAVDRIHGVGAEVLILTPHFVMPSWMGLTSVWGLDGRQACQALRDFAKERNVALADAAARWQHLASEGLPYTTLLYNGINHPDDRGHHMFVEELLTFFR